MNDYAIEAENVSKSFGPVHALDNVDLKVRTGTILALLGPNGAGKTTLVRVLTTLLRPDKGSVKVGSYDVLNEPQSVRTVIGLAGQSAAVDANLSGRENLELVGRLYHLDRKIVKERTTNLLDKFELTEAADRPSKTYSGGMRRRLDLAASLVGTPKILFLDEPTTGLDPRSRLDLWETIQNLVSQGVTVLLTTQYLEEADFLADNIAVIDRGRIIAEGTPDDLKSKIGGDVVEMHFTERTRMEEAASLIAKFGSNKPSIDTESGKIVLPVDRGTAVLPDIIRELDTAGLAMADFNFRRPSLDEVFLTLTGKPVSSETAGDLDSA